ncbi:uncharacterized protein B0H18DRAFT_1007586 [Fomitopsis serialis]|uniref:uncharacterized protein n=1 Tax=Fomitopsis serialis TaxID=139415 RepID=UPI0020071FE6|nr:uncharacterized protein B0H18DRAFT_1007586 [Neoantrodia serialis]KAH9926026.1 hypothetical protein B0H18DRAFT_1007586 [Neoantrodia serialis]
MRAADTSPSTAPDVPGVTDTAPTAVSGAPPAAATTLDESPQAQDTAQTGSVQSLDYTDPHADDSDASRGVAERGADADEGRQGGLVGAIEHADRRQDGVARPSQEEIAAPGDAPAQSESRLQLDRQNAGSG